MLIEEIFASVRAGTGTPRSAPARPTSVGKPCIEAVTGRYLHTDLNGRPHRIYFKEARPPNGIPLLCLHYSAASSSAGRACGPRTRRPGRAPVAWPSRVTIWPETSVAT